MDTNNLTPPPKRVLLAHDPDKSDFLVSALAGLEIVQVSTHQEAERMIIENGIDLFILGVHFDDSRAMQVISTIRLDEKHKETPILVVRLSTSAHTDMLRMTLDTLIKLNIVNDFIEFEKYGKNQKILFRKMVDRLLEKQAAVVN